MCLLLVEICVYCLLRFVLFCHSCIYVVLVLIYVYVLCFDLLSYVAVFNYAFVCLLSDLLD